MKKTVIIFLFIITTLFSVFNLEWPLGSGTEVQEIINSYYQFQDYEDDGGATYHSGIDIKAEPGDPVYAVEAGYIAVKYTDSASHSYLFIIDNSSDHGSGWAYCHIYFDEVDLNVGDYVAAGEQIGNIAEYKEEPSFTHLHLEKIYYEYEEFRSRDYYTEGNPLDFLSPTYESFHPVFEDAEPGQLFSFVTNETNNKISKDAVSGPVDIIVRVYDRFESDRWKIIPYKIGWRIEDSSGREVYRKSAFEFTGELLNEDLNIDVLYKESDDWNTVCNYTDRDFYFIITNTDTDGDGLIEEADKNNALCTYSFRNGDYTLFVSAFDHTGNETIEEMNFTINNPISENIFDIVQVLDCSGSMHDYVSDISTDKKIDVLKYAADQFVNMMSPGLDNQLGIVGFNEDIFDFPFPEPDLRKLELSNINDFTSSISRLEADGNTSIGNGLQEAHSQLVRSSDAESAQNILLISDGDENRELYIRNVVPDLIADSIPVHALGLGYSTGIIEEKLINLANDTGGTFRITNDDLVFRKFFLDILVNAANWCTIVDPIQYASSEPFYQEIPVGESDSKLIITAFWDGTDADKGLILNLITPSGKKITPEIVYPGIKYTNHTRYAFYQINLPLTGDMADEHEGIWYAEIYKKAGSGTIRYSIEAFSTGSINLDLISPKLIYKTGDIMQFTLNLNNNGIPINGSKITVFGEIPKFNLADKIYNEQIDNKILDEKADIKGDPVNLINQKITILEKKYGDNLYEHQNVQFDLYDDGQHGDGKSDDGIYGGSFNNTIMPGVYKFRFIAENILDNKNIVKRELTRCYYNKVNIVPEASIINLVPYYDNKNRLCYDVNVIPKDKFNNMLGPGYKISIIITYAGGKRDVLLTDNIDSTYQGNIILTPEEAKYGVELILNIEGEYFHTILNPPMQK